MEEKKISFSNKIREEICKTLLDKERKYACLYGIFLYARTFEKDTLIIQTENKIVADIILELVEEVFHSNISYNLKSDRKKTKEIYTFSVREEHQIKKIASMYKIDVENRKIEESNIINGSLAAFIAGVFLCCGSMIDPSKQYHLEFNAPSLGLCEDLKSIFSNLGIKCGITLRKKTNVLYIENSENIEDILTFMGAQQCTLELINIKIYKNFVNKTNRLTNCDFANLNKTVSASIEQVKVINKIQKNMSLEDLPKELYEVAVSRLENSEASLEEIGQMLSKPIGKSGVSRRFQRLKKISESFQEE
jgi:hypothetical protein